MITTTYSQAGQDLWVVEVMRGKRGGTFLDIGCGDPVEFNNTYLLEQDYGWKGIGVDMDGRFKDWWKERRTSTFWWQDALRAYWRMFTPSFDYLSLDIDEAQLEFVKMFPWDKSRFQVMTIEHDAYRFGHDRRDDIRRILKSHGYRIEVEDVHVGSEPAFEDWWVDSK